MGSGRTGTHSLNSWWSLRSCYMMETVTNANVTIETVESFQDMEFCIILLRANMGNIWASAIFWECFSLSIATLCNINASNQGEVALKVLVFGNNTSFCGKSSVNWLPHPNFDVFHKSFHNLTIVFREQCSRARRKLHVCSASRFTFSNFNRGNSKISVFSGIC